MADEAKDTELFQAALLKQCDIILEKFGSESYAEFTHSYPVRALCVAYDLTGEKKYLEESKAWAKRMVDAQDEMIPYGIYYMGYGRKPAEDKGQWYIGDCSSIAMGVLAVAVRCDDAKEKERYLNSVLAYARVVMDNYVGPTGGVTNGGWDKFDGEWWCSTGIFGSLAFLLYKETGNDEYLEVGLGTIDWLNRLNVHQIRHYGFKEYAPAVYFYCLESYSASMPYLKPGSERRRLAVKQLSKVLNWLSENQKSQGGKGEGRWGTYEKKWGMKLGGMPFHMYIMVQQPEFQGQNLKPLADAELRYLCDILIKDGKPNSYQLRAFTMMSLAERVAPSKIYRTSK